MGPHSSGAYLRPILFFVFVFFRIANAPYLIGLFNFIIGRDEFCDRLHAKNRTRKKKTVLGVARLLRYANFRRLREHSASK